MVLKDEILSIVLKHLAGQHDQMSHGRRGGAGGGREHTYISPSKVSATGRSVIGDLPSGVKTRSDEVGLTGHGFRYMGKSEYDKFASGEKKYGGNAVNEMERGIMFANAPGDFYYAGGKKGIYLIEVNVQGTGGGLIAPRNSVGLGNVVGAWYYDPGSKEFVNMVRDQ